jgi:dTDP-glucose 4,6-dehydratase
MDITKIGSELGWEPKESLESGLKKTLDWYLSNSAWISRINERPSYQDWIEQNYAERWEGE